MKTRAPLLVEAALFIVAVLLLLAFASPGAPQAEKATSGSTVAQRMAAHGDGLSDSRNGYLMSPTELPTKRGPSVTAAFRILGPGGKPTTEYDIAHTKPLHLYLVRDDLSGYQHLHPALSGDTWRATVSVPDGGAYRLYAEFTPKLRATVSGSIVLGVPFVIAGDTTFAPLPAPTATASADGFTVTRLDGVEPLAKGKPKLMKFQIKDAKTGFPATIEPYLGASAHASSFEALTQALAHMHPTLAPTSDGTVTLHVQFANRGEQRMYLQFQAAGAVHMAAFTLLVT